MSECLVKEREIGGGAWIELPHYLCVILFFAVHGGLSNWTAWSKCNNSCGLGIQKRERACDNPKPMGGGKDCSALGNLTETSSCVGMECPGKICTLFLVI